MCSTSDANDLRSAEYWPPQRLVGIGCFLKEVENDIVGRIIGLTDFLQHNPAFAVQFFLVEGRIQNDIGNDIERDIYIVF